MNYVLDGAKEADSIVVNPHKWLFTPIDCSAFYVRDPEILQKAFTLVPEYLKSSEQGVTNYMDWGVQLGRRFRALKLWMVLRYFGHEGLANRIREHIRLGKVVAGWVDAHPDFQRMAPVPFSTICFRALPHDLSEQAASADFTSRQEIENYLTFLNQSIVDSVNETGKIFIAPTRLRERLTLRMAIGNIRTDEAWVKTAWDLIQDYAYEIDQSNRAMLTG